MLQLYHENGSIILAIIRGNPESPETSPVRNSRGQQAYFLDFETKFHHSEVSGSSARLHAFRLEVTRQEAGMGTAQLKGLPGTLFWGPVVVEDTIA